MVILDCLKQSIFVSHHRHSSPNYGSNRLTGRTLVRSPSPGCHCSCHSQPELDISSSTKKSNVNITSTSNGADSSHIYSCVSPKVRFELRDDNSSTASFSQSKVTPTRRGTVNCSYLTTSGLDSNYCDIGDFYGYAKNLNRNRSGSGLATISSIDQYCPLYSTKFKCRQLTNILCIVRVNPFKFVAMESIHVNNRLIVFSLVDSFTKLSPNKFFENFIHKLKDEGKRSITVFNLSESLEYLRESLDVPICEFGWPEKHAPSLEKLCSLCKAIDSWLSFDSVNNVAVIYSKRDLSRASLAVAVFLEYIKICLGDDSAFDYDSMQHYYQHNLHQYLQPSQKRYIDYFIALLSGQTKINTQQFYLNNIIIRKIPNFEGDGTCKPFIKIYQGMNLIYSSSIVDIDLNYINTYDLIVFPLEPPLKLRGEILVKCCHQRTSPSSRTVMFSLQFHTGTFLNDVAVFTKEGIDIASYDKRFHESTQVEFLFNEVKFEPLENVRYFADDQITKWNSYENFFFEDKSLEYTKGPLDGSLYATIPKKPNVQSSSNNEDETILDELLNEIFLEIKSFPDVPPSPLCKESNNICNEAIPNSPMPLIGSSNEILFQSEPVIEQVIVVDNVPNETEDLVDYSEMSWLQKQQLKLRNKQDKHQPARNVEKRLLEELKHTIKNHRSVSKQLNSTGSSVEESRTPPIPTRTSSKNIVPLYAEQCQLSQSVQTSYSEHFINQTDIDLIPRSTAPKLRPTYLDGSNNSENGNFSFYSNEDDDNRNHLTLVQRSVTPSFPVRSLRNDNHLYSPTSDNGSKNYPLFIRDTSSFWYKPNISREEAVKLLQDKPPGTFIIRDSNSFHGAYGLAVKVFSPSSDSLPNSDLNTLESVRHFLIESTNKGVQIKGCSEEPVFSSLASLVNQHSITRISLPITLLIPSVDFEDQEKNADLVRIYENGAVCNVLYFTCEDVESLTGPNAIRKVIDSMFSLMGNKTKPTVVHFKASNKGITLTDNSHKLFFRQHYPLQSLRFCNIDPEGRTWRDNNSQIESVLYGIVSLKKGSTTDNECLIFGHYEPDQPSHAIVDFVNKLMTL